MAPPEALRVVVVPAQMLISAPALAVMGRSMLILTEFKEEQPFSSVPVTV